MNVNSKLISMFQKDLWKDQRQLEVIQKGSEQSALVKHYETRDEATCEQEVLDHLSTVLGDKFFPKVLSTTDCSTTFRYIYGIRIFNLLVELDNAPMAEGQTDAIGKEAALIGYDPDKRVAQFGIVDFQAIKLTVVCRNNAARSQFCKHMENQVGQACLLEPSKRNYVEITPLGVSKGCALRELLRTNEWEQTVAVGDGVNDISMFAAASLSYAMPWADDSVKESAQCLVARPGHKNLARLIMASANL